MAEAKREYEVIRRHSAMGRTRILIECPFCGAEVWAFVWSLAGSGKRCPCGALHGSLGTTKELKAEETATPK